MIIQALIFLSSSHILFLDNLQSIHPSILLLMRRSSGLFSPSLLNVMFICKGSLNHFRYLLLSPISPCDLCNYAVFLQSLFNSDIMEMWLVFFATSVLHCQLHAVHFHKIIQILFRCLCINTPTKELNFICCQIKEAYRQNKKKKKILNGAGKTDLDITCQGRPRSTRCM